MSSDAIALHDELDPTAAPHDIREMATRTTLEKIGPVQSATSVLKGLKIGIPQVCLARGCRNDLFLKLILSGRNISLRNCRLRS